MAQVVENFTLFYREKLLPDKCCVYISKYWKNCIGRKLLLNCWCGFFPLSAPFQSMGVSKLFESYLKSLSEWENVPCLTFQQINLCFCAFFNSKTKCSQTWHAQTGDSFSSVPITNHYFSSRMKEKQLKLKKLESEGNE